MNIATALKDLRLEANLTQKELAKKLNIGQSTIAQYEKGEREPTVHNLTLYCDFFGVTVDYLLGREDEAPASVHTPTTNGQTEAERELLTLFRELSPYLQDLTLQTVRNWAGKAGKPGEVNIQKKA